MKIGFIGNSCTGKTTLSMHFFLKLRAAGLPCLHYGDAGRDLEIAPEGMGDSVEAALSPFYKQLYKENVMRAKFPKVDLIFERTAIDWHFYYRRQCYLRGVDSDVVLDYCAYLSTYDFVYLLPHMGTYNTDGVRPQSNSLHNYMESYYDRFYKLHSGKVIKVEGEAMGERICFIDKEIGKIYEARM